jgi:O-antigen ligase
LIVNRERLGMSVIEARTRSGAWGKLLALSLMVFAIAFATFVVLTYLGLFYFVVVLSAVIGVFILFKVSTRDLSIAMILWFLSMSGLQYTIRLAMPGLPDLSIDRVLLIWIVIMFLLQLVIYRQKLQGPFTLDFLIIIHTVYIMVNMLFARPGALPAWLMSSLVPLFGYLYGRHIIKKDSQLRTIFYFFIALSVYYFTTAIGEFTKMDFLVWPKSILDSNVGQLWQPGRARGPVMHPPLFGQMIAMMLPFYFFVLTRRSSVAVKAILGGSFLLSMVGVFLAYTRGPWLAAAVGLMVLGVMRPNFRKVLGGLAVLGLVVGMLGLFQLADSEFLQERLSDEGTTDNRLAFLVMSVKMIADHPLFGVGYFASKDMLWLYNEGGDLPLIGHISKRSGRDMVPHDIYLGRAADEGLLSIFMLASMALLVAKVFKRKWQANPRGQWFNRDSMAVMAAITACYLVGGMAIDYRYFDLINVMIYMMMGIIYGYPIETDPEAGTPAHA